VELLDTWWSFIRDGLNHVSPLLALIIALIFGMGASSFMSVLLGALGAAVIYVVIDALWPVVFHHQAFVMPVMNSAFGHFFLSLFLAFLVLIGLIYIVKSAVAGIRG